MISLEEIERYKRQLIIREIGPEGQLKLKKAKVLIVGAGGLGCPAIQYLAASGIGELGIMDFDTVEMSNLHRQILYTHLDIGKYKANVASEHVQKQNPYVTAKAYVEKLSDLNAEKILSNYDIVLDCTDNFTSRYMIDDICKKQNKVFVYGAVHQWEGHVSVFNFEPDVHYRSLFPNKPEEGAVPNCADNGVLGIVPGVIGTLQANEVLKIVLGFKHVLSKKLLIFNNISLKTTLIQL